MSVFKDLVTNQDRLEAANIEKRRQFEEERKRRIFDARKRVIGVDSQGLAQQVHEKQQIKQSGEEREANIIAQQRQQHAVQLAKEQELQMERRRIHREVNEFRLKLQKPEDRRDFDLYDPHGKKKDLPARISDWDPRLTVSSAQRFEGEDLYNEERKKAQINQQKAWLEQQMKERREAEKSREIAEKTQYEALMARESRAVALERIERRGKHNIFQAVAEFNRQLAAEQENMRKLKKRQEEEDNLAEQINHITSDILTESPDCETSSFGAHRIVPYSYRRMTPEQIHKLAVEKTQQMEEKNRKRADEREVSHKWDLLAGDCLRTMTLQDSQARSIDRDRLAQTIQENAQLAQEQHEARTHIEKFVYTNEPTEDYHKQFNTTSR